MSSSFDTIFVVFFTIFATKVLNATVCYAGELVRVTERGRADLPRATARRAPDVSPPGWERCMRRYRAGEVCCCLVDQCDKANFCCCVELVPAGVKIVELRS